MISDTDPVALFLAQAREKRTTVDRPKSKLEPHREAIIAAVNEGVPVTTIQAVLAEHYGLKVSYSNLSGWIHRQPEFRKTAKGGTRKPMTKARQAAWDKLANRDPNEPLTLEK
jgi:hypothetical protein